MLAQPRLNPETTAAAIAYLAGRIARPDFYMLGHLLYLADKRHLETYGRSITGERYYALPHGPVPTDTYAALQAVAGVEPWKERVHGHLTALLARILEHVEGNDFRVRDEPDLGQLSDSDIECLDSVIESFGDGNMERVRRATHDAAYTKVWDRAQAQGRKSAAMPLEEIVDTLQDSEVLRDYLADPFPS